VATDGRHDPPLLRRPLDAARICATLRRRPSLLTNDETPPCADLQYWNFSVRVSGDLDGMNVGLVVTSCAYFEEDRPAGAAQRWADLLGLAPVGPDPG
jgi:hypothetical protein